MENEGGDNQKSVHMYDSYIEAVKEWSQKKELKTWDRTRLENLEEELVIGFLYPRLDFHVSTDMKHLLKSPFVIHPSTGNLSILIVNRQYLCSSVFITNGELILPFISAHS